MRWLSGWAVSTALVLWMVAGVNAAIFEDGDFQQQVIPRPDGGNWEGVVGMQFSADGQRLFAWERNGKVWVIDQQQPVTTPILDISDEALAWADYGMLGFALDPNFDQNGHVYLSYMVDRHHLEHCQERSSDDGPPICDDGYDPDRDIRFIQAIIGRITRYTLIKPDGDSDFRNAVATDYQSRRVLVGRTMQSGMPAMHQSHGVGQLVFGTDGSLMAAFGDAASFNRRDVGSSSDTAFAQALADGIITPEENVGAYRAQMINSLGGKILRINPQTGEGYPSNPFYQAANPKAAASRVWAMGLRNPYRLSLKPGTGSHNPDDGNPGVLFIGDVGYHDWEELNIAERGGENFGWPTYEGMGFENEYWRTSPTADDASDLLGCNVLFRDLLIPQALPSLLVNDPCSDGQLTGYPAFYHQRPALVYNHDSPLVYTPQYDFNGDGISLALGDALPGTAEVPATGTAFTGNSVTGGVWYQGEDFPQQYRNRYFFGDFGGQWLRYANFDELHRLTNVAPFARDTGGVVFITSNPVSGGLYYVSWASILYRIDYAPGGNRPPTAQMSASRYFGPAPLAVQFSGADSSDPEDDNLNFSWDFGDGNGSNDEQPLHQFVADSDAPQSFVVTLTVSDNGDPQQSDSATALISVNNTPPSVAITSPLNNSLYPLDAESFYQLQATISDAEHSADQLSCRWQVELFHNNHSHQDPPLASCQADVALAPVGCDGDTYHYQISLTVTDADGLASSDLVRLFPDCGSIIQPIAQDDAFSVQLGETATLAILDNDLNVDQRDQIEIELLSPPMFGALTLNSQGQYRYRAFGGAAANDSFQYRLRGPTGLSSQAQVSLTLHNDGGYLPLPTVQFSPNGGQFDEATEVTLSHSDGAATIHYQWDDAAVNHSAMAYGGSISVNRSGTLYARAYRDGWLPSAVSSAAFSITSRLPASLQQQLLGYWPLDEGQGVVAEDFSGNGHLGQISGASWDQGWSGQALRFDGLDDQVTVADDPRLRFAASDSFSLSVWVKPGSPQAGWRGVVTKARENRNWYGLWISSNDQWVFGGPGNLVGAAVADGWHHLLLVQDGVNRDRHLYIDGALAISSVAQAADDAGDLIFGAASSVAEAFDGWIDEVRLYGRVLDSAERTALSTIMPVIPEPPQPPAITTTSDVANVSIGQSVSVDVLANDSALAGFDLASVTVVTPPTRGSIEGINGLTGAIDYRPEGSSSGSDQFSYTVADVDGNRSAATQVSITISGDEPQPDGLLGYWPLDNGNAMDLSGNGRHGVVNGAVESLGRFGGALQFDGNDDWVQIADEALLRFGASDSFSLSVWVQADGLPNQWKGLVTKGRGLRNWYGLWISANNQWCFGGRANLCGPVIDSQWHHLMLVQDGSRNQRDLYLDGVLAQTGPAVDGSDAGDLFLGAAEGVDEFYRGKLDQLRLYGRALNGSEIADLVNEQPDSSAPVLITNNDSATLEIGQTVDIDLLANDVASAGFEVSTLQIVTPPQFGEIANVDPLSGVVSYRHTGSDAGSDSFSYQLEDSRGELSELATVNLTINPDGEPQLPLIGYWPLDLGGDDLSGNSHHGVVSGAAPVAGQFNGGLRFDGVDDRVTINHHPQLAFSRTDSFTLSLWLQVELDSSGWRGIVTKSRDQRPWYGLWLSPSADWIFGSASGNGAGGKADGQWHHLVLVQDGASQVRRLYLDGVQRLERASVDGDGLGDLIFGDANGAVEPFKGSMDEIRLYGEALSNTEVQALMLLVPPPQSEQVIAADDQVQLAELGQVDIDLLANDSANSGFDLSSFELLTAPQAGRVEFDDSTGIASYQHQGTELSDSFRYRLRSNDGNLSNGATVTITINPVAPPSISLSTDSSEIPVTQSLIVRWQLGGDLSAFDHLHLSLDGAPHVTLHDYSGGSYDFGVRAVGEHSIRGWLVSSDHVPVDAPESDQTITVVIYQPPAVVNFSQPAGNYAEPISVELSNGDASAIHYSTDGSVPDASSPQYSDALTVDSTTIITAVSIDAQGRVGEPSSALYVIESDDPLPTAGLLGHWPLDAIVDGQTQDLSGNQRHGVNVNGVAVQGQHNGGLFLNGSDAYVEVADDAAMRFGKNDAFTLSLWLQIDGDVNRWTGVVTKSRDQRPWYGLWIAPWQRWIFGGPSNLQGPSIGNALDNQWHHLLLRQAGGVRELWLDGTRVASGASQDGDGNGVLWFGGSAGINEYFRGSLDEIRLYDRALTDAEVQQLSQPTVP